MKITLIGTGYVGLVTGTCFAETGNDVTCMDIDADKVARLTRGEVPIYEPGLAELIHRNTQHHRLRFTTDLSAAVAGADLVFIAVGTPQADDGRANLSSLFRVVEALAACLDRKTIVVIKSTVPVGTNAKAAGRLKELTGHDFEVASNPEFLKEGAAIDDFMRPDRVVVGVRRHEAAERLHDLYRPFLRTERPFLTMSPESAEMTKYVANALLATKISFINEMANLCGALGADINEVRRGIGHDERIGFAFLFPGLGYGGSCFPKDIRALAALAGDAGVPSRLLPAIDEVNNRQKTVLLERIDQELGQTLKGKKVAIWGLAFKPRTDDIREAPALAMIDHLLKRGATVHVHDPEAMENVRRQYGDALQYADETYGPYSTLDKADALAICTEWKEYQHPDFSLMKKLMRRPLIFDGRNLYEPSRLKDAGFTYYSIGRASVHNKASVEAKASVEP
jgi:UDPglucose 6-dehydrogenase